MRDGIDWREVGSGDRFEKIVSVLLSTLHPQSLRIDGGGGDGGRDHQLHTDERLDIWQSKYFIGRISEGGRKNQIKRSLLTASALQPDNWYLVTPMDPTPEELKWLETEAEPYLFPAYWKGGAWLDAQLALHPAIINHFMGAEEKYIELLRELKQEQDALVDGLPAGRERLERLAAQIDDSDPFYSVDMMIQGGKITKVALKPKYRGAENDSPITANFNVAINESEANDELLEKFHAALDWGDEATVPINSFTVNAPHGLGGTFENGYIRIGPADREIIDLQAKVVSKSPEGRQLASLPITLRTRTYGNRGPSLRGEDRTGIFAMTMRLDVSGLKLMTTFGIQPTKGLLPGEILPVIRFLQHAAPPNKVAIVLGDRTATEGISIPELTAGFDAQMVQLIEELDSLQRAAGEVFPVPDAWTSRDIRELRIATKLLNGERVRIGRGPFLFSTADSPEEMVARFRESPKHSLAIVAQQDYVATIAKHELNLGPYTLYVQVGQVHPEHPVVDSENGPKIQFIPDEGYGVEAALGMLTIEAGQPPAEPVDN